MGLLLFDLETAKAQETLTDKYLAPLCLKYLSFALDTMSTNASLSSIVARFLSPQRFLMFL